jgi:replicative DNA helicase
MLHREGALNPEVENPNLCECIVEKNRRGETGTIKLNFEGEFYSFTTPNYIYADEH